MQIFLVGGAVRDALLGLPVRDRDWVVVGATPQQMIDLGYLPVGRDFPVFLHPVTHEEYALARTERKTAPGYRGFAVHAAPDVTLEQDLARRDLTINSIADSSINTGTSGTINALIDPFHGQRDLQARVLRHVTDAFREDPVRILRVARFAARFTDFSVAPETLRLMQDMVAHGEADHLVPERVWQEMAKGLMEATPSKMFHVLRECHALKVLLPELDATWGLPKPMELAIKWGSDSNFIDTGEHVMKVLDRAAQLNAPLSVRFACLVHDLGEGTPPAETLARAVCERLRVPTECRDLADVVAREHRNIQRSGNFSAAETVHLMERCDAFRKPARFADLLLACECDALGSAGLTESSYPQRARLLEALRAAQSIATHLIANNALLTGTSGQKIGEMIHAARVEAVAAMQMSTDGPSPAR